MVSVMIIVSLLAACCGNGQRERPGSELEQAAKRPSAAVALTPAQEQKIGPALRRELAALIEAGKSGRTVSIIGRYDAGLKAEELRRRIAAVGGTVATVTSSTFTLQCPAENVKKIARLDEVLYLDLAMERRPAR